MDGQDHKMKRREREGRARPPEGEEEAAAHHGRRCEARRRRRLWRYGAPISQSRALWERGARGEFIPKLRVAEEMSGAADHGGAMAGSFELTARTLGGTKSRGI